MFRLTLLLLPLLFLTLLEISLRLGHYGYDPSFFKRITIGGQDCFVQNEEFSFRFFPRAIARNPGPLRFPVQKAPGTFRIFILGESAAMGDPAESVGPWRYLEMLLRKKYPDQKFEIINVAFTAINSNVILPIARECAGLQGDLWIIYMGNNEMVGPFGAATVFGRQAAPLPYVRLVTGLQRFRTGQLMTALARRFTGRHEEAVTWGGMGMFLHNQIDPASPRKETVYRNFERNLHDIVRLGIGSGAKVLLNTVAVNLKDCPPFASVTNSQLSAPDRAQFEEQCAKATEASQRGDWQEAATRFEQAARIDAKSAELQFHWAQCLLAQTNPALAREHFQLACDNDALPFRADSRINAVIQAESKRNGAGTFMLLDAPAALAAIGESGICGQEAFYEHVHFDFAGRYGLGRAWAEQIEHCFPPRTNEWISQAECEQSLGLSEWNRAQVIHFMAERMQVPPLSSQPNNPARKEALETRISQLGSRMTSDNARGMSNVFVSLLEQRPDDYFLRQNFAVFLELTGYPVSAALEWEHFCDLLPQDSLGFYQVGRLLIVQQRYAEAEGALRTSLAIRPSRTEAWIELGNVMALQKKYAEALVVYSTALSRDPQNAQTYLRMGKVLAHLDRHREAIEKYGRAIEFNPADGLSHFELGSELLAAHDEELAGRQFGEAARLLPTHVPSRFNYGTWLMKQKRWTEARTEFEAVLNLEPRNTRARQNLAWLKEKTQ